MKRLKSRGVFKIRRGFKAIGRGGHNIKWSLLTGYELDVIREGDVATGEDDDVELTEFQMKSKAGLLKNLLKLV
jgi:N utilization substance protein A